MGSDSSKPTSTSTSTSTAAKYTPERESTSSDLEKKEETSQLAGLGATFSSGNISTSTSPTGKLPSNSSSADSFSSEIVHPVEPSEPETMAMSGLEEQLREMLECKICFEDKEKQKLLPCQHTICVDCLKKLQVKHSKYKCPLCNREMLVPNGGFDALPESLITKQLAHLIRPRDKTAAQPAVRPKVPQPALQTMTAATVSDGLEKKVRENIKKGKDTLEASQTKIKCCTSMVDDLEQTAERMKQSINNLMEQTIDRLMVNAGKKVSSIDELLQKKKDELLGTICKLSDTNSKASRGIDLLERRVATQTQNLRQTIVGEEVQTTQSSLKDLEEMLEELDTEGGEFRAGDSVRLRMDESLLTSEFLLSDLNHHSIGFIHQVDDDGDCAVIFPENSRWTGNVSSLEKSSTKHDLPVVGDRVRVKDSVTTPHFKWGMVKRGSIGILTEMKNSGPSKGRQVEVDFPEDHDWSALYDELEKVPPEPLKVGEKVWMGANITEPARGWAGVTPTSVGTLSSVNGGEVEVNFPECNNWKGLLEEIERTRPITVGDKVKVKQSVTEPKFAWGGVDHDDVGKVTKILNSPEHGHVVKVDFPNRLGLWQCLLTEIEIVSRHTGSEPSRTRRSSDGIQCPTQ